MSMPSFNDREMSDSLPGVQHDQMAEDVEMKDPDHEGDQPVASKHFTVAIDFGTTFSSVSFIALESPETKRRIHPNQICSVEQYPYAPSLYYEQRKEVPTESWYPRVALRDDVYDTEPQDMSARDGSSEDGSDTDRQATRVETTHGGATAGPTGDEEEEEAGEEDAGEEDADDETSREYFWGYGVQKQLQYPDSNRAQTRRIARSKLLLDTSPYTATIRAHLKPSLDQLKKLKVIKEDTDVITDFLEHLFQHTKAQLIRSHGFHDACSVEFVLCVPAIWTQKACRTMQTAMATAMSRSGFGKADGGSVDNLFIVSEPEAAAACVLAESGQSILVRIPLYP
jgi:hypothetical protein